MLTMLSTTLSTCSRSAKREHDTDTNDKHDDTMTSNLPPRVAPCESSAVLEQLAQLVRAQSHQGEKLQSIQDQMVKLARTEGVAPHPQSDFGSSSDGSRKQSHPLETQVDAANVQVRLPQLMHGRRRSLGRRRRSSWAWDPQVQGDLELAFKVRLGSVYLGADTSAEKNGVRICAQGIVAENKEEPSSGERTQQGETERSTSGTAPCSSTLGIIEADENASTPLNCVQSDQRANAPSPAPSRQTLSKPKVAYLVARRLGLCQQATGGMAPARQKTMLRSSWLYRQRAAGRVRANEHGPCTWSALCISWLPVVPPESSGAVIWDFLTTVAVVFVATFTPLQVAFYRSFDHLPWHGTNLACELVFILNPLTHVHRGFTHDGVSITDPEFIAAHYLRNRLVGDMIGSFPYAWILGIRLFAASEGAPPPSAIERLLPLLRLVRVVIPLVHRMSVEDSETSARRRLNPGVARMMWVILLLVYSCHWMGCLWWTVSELEEEGLFTAPDNHTAEVEISLWRPNPWLRTQTMVNQYGHAFLWGAGMMTGFVPTDVSPSTLPEVVVTILALFVGLMVNTGIISSTTSALQSMSFKSSHVVHKMQNIAQHMHHKRVPPLLAKRIIGFYRYQLSPRRSNEGQHELSDLPPLLAMELIMHVHQELFRDCPIFKLVPPPTALSLVERFESVVFTPGEIVIHEGKPNAALYVINRGLVTVWRHDPSVTGGDGRIILTTLTDSDFFGEQTLLKVITSTSGGPAEQSRANASCQCASYCDMFRLTSDDFLAVIEEGQNREASWERKDVAGILKDAADERNTRADRVQKKHSRSLMWAMAGEKAMQDTREKRFRENPLKHSRCAMSLSPFASRRSKRRAARNASRDTDVGSCAAATPDSSLQA